ncbi:MAG TPA: chorismate mutase [Acidimicrobiales bacterium]|jgi:chorismate mutase|nr:chorismate mutase [Acidimicrobiales bacterium]
MTVRALRGATTVDEDTSEQVTERVQELLGEVMDRNGLVEDDVISIVFTTTADVVSMFPATAARGIGFGAVPLLCAAEIPVPGAMPSCIRALLHVDTDRPRSELRHVYLHRAQGLRDDLPG